MSTIQLTHSSTNSKIINTTTQPPCLSFTTSTKFTHNPTTLMTTNHHYLQDVIDRYLYPDQIIFGHLFNPSTKSAQNYQMARSSPDQAAYDQLILYQKSMSNVKIQSMLNMMQGKHQPLFKSSVLPSRNTHLQMHQNSDGQESYEQQDDDYEDYDEEMYLMEKDYEGEFQDEYDFEENPLMAFGQGMGAGGLPMRSKLRNYNTDFIIPNNPSSSTKPKPPNLNPRLFLSQQPLTQQGLGQLLSTVNPSTISKPAIKKDKKVTQEKGNTKKNSNENGSDEDWETESEEDVEGEE